MPKLKFLKSFSALSLAFLLSSCASVPDNPPVDPLALLDADAPMYIYIPVAQNVDFVRKCIEKYASVSEADAARIASRTDVLACAAGLPGSSQISAGGNYPLKYISYGLNEKSGWSEQTAVFASNSYVLYQNDVRNMQISLPCSHNALISSSVMPMLSRYDFNAYDSKSSAASAPAGFSDELYRQLTGGKEGEINFYSEKPGLFISAFLGKPVELGITKISGFLKQSKSKQNFGVTITLELEDPRTIKAASALLKRAMFPVTAKITQSSSRTLTVSDITISWDRLIALMDM